MKNVLIISLASIVLAVATSTTVVNKTEKVVRISYPIKDTLGETLDSIEKFKNERINNYVNQIEKDINSINVQKETQEKLYLSIDSVYSMVVTDNIVKK